MIPTPTADILAARMAALAEIEADPSRFETVRKSWYANGREWTIWRAGDGTVDFDIAVAQALRMAGHVREAAETPWRTRVPLAVARSRRAIGEPPSIDDPWAYRRAWPGNKSGVAVITAAALIATPDDFEGLGIHVEMLRGRAHDRPRRS